MRAIVPLEVLVATINRMSFTRNMRAALEISAPAWDRARRANSGTPGLRNMREGTTHNEEIAVHWYESGPQDAPLTVVYVHGFNISSQSFYLQERALRPLGVRQLLIDVRGHGHTATDTVAEFGAASPSDLSVDGAADDVMAVIAERGVVGPVIVVGHSLGGPISLSLIRRYAGEPDGFDLAGSVQISSAVDPFTDRGMSVALGGAVGAVLYRAVQAMPGLSEAVRVGLTSALAPLLAVGFYAGHVPWEIIRFHADMIQGTPLRTYEGFFPDLREHSERDVADKLAGVPGYILVGELDTVAPLEHSEALHEVWPDAALQVVPTSGHMPPLDAAGAVTAALVRLIHQI